MMRRKITLIVFLFLTCILSAQNVEHYRAEAVMTYPHDESSYTQGLFFCGDTLYESTGIRGESTMRIVDITSGRALRKLDFSKSYFVEGSTILDGRLYILTWQNRQAFAYDAATMKYLATYSYPREGWGLTTDGKSLIASDGSAVLYYMDKDLRVQRRLTVTLRGRGVKYLNELEYIDGMIWANVYTTDMIVVIDPADGKVRKVVDCSLLCQRDKRTPGMDVLNGIAVNKAGQIFLTGKYWPYLYRIRLIRTD